MADNDHWRGSIADRLIALADPERADPSPGAGLTARQLDRLLVLAEGHGVLGIVLANLQRPEEPARLAVHEAASSRHNAAVGLCLMLRQTATSVMNGVVAAGMPAVVVRGPLFAQHLYPRPSMRTYADIDFLARGSGMDWVRDGLCARGLRPVAGIDPAARQWQFFSPDYPHLTIGLQSDLVPSPRLRARMRLTYSDLVADGAPDSAASPAALLSVAAVHGAAHQFDRLRHLADVVQAARRLSDPAEELRLEAITERTGTRFALVAALNLAGRVYDDRRCREIAVAFGPIERGRLFESLINGAVVVAMRQRRRHFYRWRRAIFRNMLEGRALPGLKSDDSRPLVS